MFHIATTVFHIFSNFFYSPSKTEIFKFFKFYAATWDIQIKKKVETLFIVIKKRKSLKIVLYIYLEKFLRS